MVSSSPKNGVLDRIVLGASACICLVSVALLVVHYRAVGHATPGRQPALEGTRVSTLAVGDSAARQIPLSGRAHVLYVFSTTCRYCQQQQEHMAGLLCALPSETVISLSEEPERVIASYWTPYDVNLPRPEHLRSESAARLALPGTPALLFVSASGIVKRAYVGTVLDWDAHRIQRELESADH